MSGVGSGIAGGGGGFNPAAATNITFASGSTITGADGDQLVLLSTNNDIGISASDPNIDNGYNINFVSSSALAASNGDGGSITNWIGLADGSGTDGSFIVKTNLGSKMLELKPSGLLTGTAAVPFEISAAAGQSLYLTAPNQILLNSAGHYIRMGNGFLNLPSDGGFYFCDDTTASTPQVSLTYVKNNFGGPNYHDFTISSDDAQSGIAEPVRFKLMSVNNPGFITHYLEFSSAGGNIGGNVAVINAYSTGAFSGASSLDIVTGACTLNLNGDGVFTFNQRINSSGPFRFTGIGNGIQIKEGTNAVMGVAALIGGTVTVNTTAVTANSRIFITSQSPSGTPGWLRVSARVAATSFDITSSSGTDTSTVAWMIIEPSP